MSSGESILARAKSTIDTTGFREQSWTGTFAQYVDVVRREPRVTRTAFERIYDMILEQGVREYVDNRKKIVHYDFFDDVTHAGETRSTASTSR
jgi:serine protein kinase